MNLLQKKTKLGCTWTLQLVVNSSPDDCKMSVPFSSGKPISHQAPLECPHTEDNSMVERQEKQDHLVGMTTTEV